MTDSISWEYLIVRKDTVEGDTFYVLVRNKKTPQWWQEVAAFYDRDRARRYVDAQLATWESETDTVPVPTEVAAVTPSDNLEPLLASRAASAFAGKPRQRTTAPASQVARLNKPPVSWTPEEDEKLQPYLAVIAANVDVTLPNRSREQILARIRRLRQNRPVKPPQPTAHPTVLRQTYEPQESVSVRYDDLKAPDAPLAIKGYQTSMQGTQEALHSRYTDEQIKQMMSGRGLLPRITPKAAEE